MLKADLPLADSNKSPNGQRAQKQNNMKPKLLNHGLSLAASDRALNETLTHTNSE